MAQDLSVWLKIVTHKYLLNVKYIYYSIALQPNNYI